MSTYTLPYFGQLDLANLEDYYQVEIEFEGGTIEIDLNFEETSIDAKRMDKAVKFIETISAFDKKNKKYIEKDFKDEEGDTVREYISHHLQDINREELAGLVDFDNKSVSPEEQLFKQLRLVRMGLYPESEDQFAIFDYSIGVDLTNYLVVINTDEKGKLDYMTMES
ncbi:MAG TPA: DUF2004 domain-containing protein [Puia sp.]|nr:DUF2004 domain-containing protein [Puia sp.]